MKRKGAERGRQIRPLSRSATVRRPLRGKATAPVTILPRKPAKHIRAAPVPQTDTRGRVEHTKALGRPTVKELGKPAP